MCLIPRETRMTGIAIMCLGRFEFENVVNNYKSEIAVCGLAGRVNGVTALYRSLTGPFD